MNLKAFNEGLNSSFDKNNQYKEWSMYRETITSYVESVIEDRVQRILIVGAGNCNDIDLKVLNEKCHTLILSDVDGLSVNEGLVRQKAEGVVEVLDYLGIEGTGIIGSLRELCCSFDSEAYGCWLKEMLVMVESNRFICKGEIPDVVVVMPIYTQLVFRQVEEQLKASFQEGIITLKAYGQTVRELLDVMPRVIKAFNKNLIELTKWGARLIVFSDYLEDQPDGYYSKAFELRNFDEVYDQYYLQHGIGLGHYGMYDLEEKLEHQHEKWFLWPFTKERILFVKGECFVAGTS